MTMEETWRHEMASQRTGLNRLEIGEGNVRRVREQTIGRLLIDEPQADDGVLKIEAGCASVLQRTLQSGPRDDVLSNQRVPEGLENLSGRIPGRRSHLRGPRTFRLKLAQAHRQLDELSIQPLE